MKYFAIFDKNIATIFQLQWKISNISDMFLQYSVLCGVLLHHFIPKKTAAESHRILVKVYGEHAFEKCWFRPQQQRPWKTTEKIWRCRTAGIAERRLTLKQLAKALGVDQGTISRSLHVIEKIQKEGKWVPYKWKESDIERQETT